MEEIINTLSFKLEDFERLVYLNNSYENRLIYEDFEQKIMDYENRMSNLKHNIFDQSSMKLTELALRRETRRTKYTRLR